MKPIAEIQHLSVDLTKQNLAKFKLLFSDDDTCMRLLSELKWKEGFTCSKCGHTNSCSGKSPYSRRCTRCKKEESATANTIFHHCRIPLRKAFEMAYLACTFPAISSYEISRQFEIRHMTCYNFKKKVLRCKEGGQVEKLFAKLIMEVNHRLGSDEIA